MYIYIYTYIYTILYSSTIPLYGKVSTAQGMHTVFF